MHAAEDTGKALQEAIKGLGATIPKLKLMEQEGSRVDDGAPRRLIVHQALRPPVARMLLIPITVHDQDRREVWLLALHDSGKELSAAVLLDAWFVHGIRPEPTDD